MATKDFKVRNGLIVGGSLTLGGNTVNKLLDSDAVIAISGSSTSSNVVHDIGGDSDQAFSKLDTQLNAAGTPVTIGDIAYVDGSDSVAYLATGTPLVFTGSHSLTMSSTAPSGDQRIIIDGLKISPLTAITASANNNTTSNIRLTGAVLTASNTAAAFPAGNAGAFCGWQPNLTLNIPGEGSARTNVHCLVLMTPNTVPTYDGAAYAFTATIAGIIPVSNTGSTTPTDIRGNFYSWTSGLTTTNISISQSGASYGLFPATLGSSVASQWTKISSAGSVDSDVAAIAELRRDADSDGLKLSALKTQVDNLGGNTAISVKSFTFTSAATDSDFSGSDDNGQTLSYVVGKIHVYLNGTLLTDTVDYLATDGTTVSLIDAPDSDDIVTVIKFLGTVQAGFDSDQIVAIINENTSAGSIDSDVAAVAELRRDADSDSIRIQEIATSLEQINGLVDSDLKAIADLRNDLDSETARISGLGVTVTEVTDSDGREAIASPAEGDIAVQFRSGSGTNTGISHDFSGGQLWSKTNYLANGTLGLTYVTANDVGNGRFKWSHATFDDHVQKGDVIVVENATVTSNPGVNPWASKSGTLLFVCHTPKIGSTAPWYNMASYFYIQAQGTSGWMNTDISGYFGDTGGTVNTTNPRGAIPASAQMVHSYGNVNNSSTTTSLSGGVATLYRMFSADTYQDAYDTSGGSASAYDDHTGNAVTFFEKPLVYIHDGSNFKSYVQDQILATIDSDYVANIVNDNTSSSSSSGGVSLTEVTDSDGREAIASPKEGDLAIQYGLGPGSNTGITNNYSNGNVMTYVGGSGTTYNNGQQTFTSSVFAPHAQVGDVIVVENSTVTGSNGYSQTGTLITAVCELIDNTTFKVMHTFGWSWNSQPGGTGGHPASGLVNRALKNYFDNAANPRGDIPSAAVAAGAGGGNAHAASFAWTGGVATLYRMFDTVESVFQANPSSGFTNGAPHAYNDNVDGTVVAAGYSKPEVWVYQDSDDLTPAGWKSHFKHVSFDSDQIVAIINENPVSSSVDSDVAAIAELRRDADSDSIRIQEIATSLEQINELVDSDLKAIADLRNDLDSESSVIRTDMDVNFTITNSGASAYSYTGDGFPSSVNNPTLYLNRGHTYNFRVNASGHPFQIRTTSGGSAYNSGVTNNGAQVGLVKFVVPMDAPESLVYQCTLHGGMVGSIKIGNPDASIADSDLKAIADLRNDVDSDSAKIQSLQEAVNQLRTEQDSDSANSGGSGGGAAGFDSDQIVAIINENTTSGSGSGMTDSDLKVVADLRDEIDALQSTGSVPQESTFTTFKYKATQGQTVFSGVDRSNQTLAYNAGNINVFINGVLINDSDDYTATNGTSITLLLAADSDDVVIIQKHASLFDSDTIASVFNSNLTDLDITRFDFTATQGQTVFSGNDDNGIALEYSANKIQVYLNGILLLNTTDYVSTDGTSITLVTAADSDDKLSIIKYLGKVVQGITNIQQTVFTFTTTAPQSTFTGDDDNGETLEYSVGRIQLYLNGLLLTEGVSKDYTATNGTSVLLTEPTDSEDIVTIVKYIGAPDDILTNKFIYKVSPAGNHTPFDSEFTGVDENGSVLKYTPDKIQVFLNGILLQDSDDYNATDGSSIKLLTAPDSEDVLVVYRYLGSQNKVGFDSDQVVAIINENLPVDQTGFDSDQVVAIVNENPISDIIFIDGNNAADKTYDGIYWTDGTDSEGVGAAFNIGNLVWDPDTGKVTVPVDGVYEIIWTSYNTASGNENGHPQRWQLRINQTLEIGSITNTYLQSSETFQVSTTVYRNLSADDEIQIYGAAGSSWRPRVYGGSGHTFLQVRRIT